MTEAEVSLPDDADLSHRRDVVDVDGTHWRQRGMPDRELSMAEIHKLLMDRKVAVLLSEVGRVRSVVGDRREALWQEMQPFLLGTVERDNPNDHTDFDGVEYRTADRTRRMLVIYTGC